MGRRRKKKKSSEKCEEDVASPDIDSGYFYGPESSSDLTSETELFSDLDEDCAESAECIENKNFVEITSEQIQSSAVTDIQFGDVHEILKELALNSKNDQSKKSNNTQKPHDNEEDISDVKEGNVKVITENENIVSSQEAETNVSKTIAKENDEGKLVREDEIKVSEPKSKENEVSCVNESLEDKNFKSVNSTKQNKKSKKKKSKKK